MVGPQCLPVFNVVTEEMLKVIFKIMHNGRFRDSHRDIDPLKPRSSNTFQIDSSPGADSGFRKRVVVTSDGRPKMTFSSIKFFPNTVSAISILP